MEDFKDQITSFGHVMENHITNKGGFFAFGCNMGVM